MFPCLPFPTHSSPCHIVTCLKRLIKRESDRDLHRWGEEQRKPAHDVSYHFLVVGSRSDKGCTALPPQELCGPPRFQVAPPPQRCDCLRRVKTIRFMEGCRFTFMISRNRPLRERRRLETSPVALLSRPAETAAPQCSTQPFSLIRDRPRTLARI